jgi:hypothetical protein
VYALARNLPKQLELIVANGIVHARRRFVEVAPNFPKNAVTFWKVLAACMRTMRWHTSRRCLRKNASTFIKLTVDRYG